MGQENKQRVPLLDKIVPYKNGTFVLKTLVGVAQPAAFLCKTCGKPVIFKLPQPGLMGVKCRQCGTLTYVKAKPVEAPAQQTAAPGVEKPQPAKTDDKQKQQDEEPKKTVVVGSGRGNRSQGVLIWGNIFNRKKFPLSEGTYVIGRKDSKDHSDIELEDKEVSRRSVVLEVTRKENGRFFFKMTVKKALNPVLHNNRPLGVSESIFLNYGDSIQLGRTVINFRELKK